MRVRSMVVFAAAASIAPFLLGVGDAHATVNSSGAEQAFTYKTTVGRTVTCTVNGGSSHDTDASTVTAHTSISESTDPDCQAQLFVTIVFDDENGVRHRLSYSSPAAYDIDGGADHAVGNISVTHSAGFPHCDRVQNSTCSVQLTTAPK